MTIITQDPIAERVASLDWTDLRHGVSTITRGSRTALGIIFDDAA
ncbi:MAG: hypothetical protein ACR2LK_01120 [Solirubrobacteraceae bacterium]